MASINTKRHKSFYQTCITLMGNLCREWFKPRGSWGRRRVLGKGRRTDCAAAVTNGCCSQQHCCCCVCKTRQEWSITPPPQTLIPHRLGLMAVWQEKGIQRCLAVVKNSGGTFFSLKGGRAKALPFQLRDVFSGIAKWNVTHLVTWQRHESSCRLDRAGWKLVMPEWRLLRNTHPPPKKKRQAGCLDDV